MSNKVHEILNNNINYSINYKKRGYYDSISKGYEELHKDEQLKKIQLIKQLIPIKPNSKILDLGCGPYFSKWDVSFDGKSIAGLNIIGLDPSKELLKIAAKKRIKTILAKAESLPFSNNYNNYFDYVFSITAIQNFDDVEKALKEIKRVIKKRGNIVITILKTSAKKEAITDLIKKHFNITKTIEEEKDVILLIRK